MFIRTRDDIQIISGDDHSLPYISFTDNKENRKSNRKWNVIKKFKINQTQLDYFDEELMIKMIPKNEVDAFNSIDIKLIMTVDSNVLVYQEFSEYPCKFLVVDDDSGLINTIDFFDIQLDKTEIFCYDIATSDYYLSCIQSAALLTIGQCENEDRLEPLYSQHLNSLSKYILHSNQHTGFIINNILVF